MAGGGLPSGVRGKKGGGVKFIRIFGQRVTDIRVHVGKHGWGGKREGRINYQPRGKINIERGGEEMWRGIRIFSQRGKYGAGMGREGEVEGDIKCSQGVTESELFTW